MGYNKENLYQILLNANTNGYQKNIPLRTFILLYKSSPKYVVLASIIVLFVGILPFLNILVMIRLIDSKSITKAYAF
ncbi:hypothetical protein BHU50_01690 [Helicobacter pylori]|uniref:ABC transporter ATP-binding protein n=1 Tax=Helicobacter pylori TaxID=210 RepID=A0A1Q9J9W5_HELPX|nr:hypothetical protein BHU50_01690 [Helicobacter pylori]OLR46925.1 hypothetical protein BIZ48_02880 [Helicobacter pylori]